MKHIVAYLARREGRAGTDLFVLAALFAAVFFFRLGGAPLLNPDESRYAEIAREMVEGGDCVTPHLNYVEYFEKPPLFYWLCALAFRILGETEFAARLWSALFGLAGVLAAYAIGRAAWGRREGLLSALVLGTSPAYIVQGRLAITDMALAFFMTASLGLFFAASRGGAPRRGLLGCLAWLCAAGAVLVKGPVGAVLAALIAALYLATGGRRRLLVGTRPAAGAALFALAVAPWFALVSIRHPEFFRFFFVTQHLERFFTGNLNRREPFLFFAPVLLVGMFPWSCFLPSACVRAAREGGRGGAAPGIFMLLWAGTVLGFFTLSGSKLATYILPMFPAAALLVGREFARAFDGGIAVVRGEAVFASAAMLAGAGGLGLYVALAGEPRIGGGACALLVVALAGAGIFGIAALRGGSGASFFCGVCLILYAAGLLAPGVAMQGLQRSRSLKELAMTVRARARFGETVCSYGFYAQDLPFYAKRRIVLVGARDELAFGRSRLPRRTPWFLRYRTFWRLWDEGGACCAVIDRDDVPLLERSVRTPVRVLARKGRKELVANR